MNVSRFEYPLVRRDETVVDNYHGTEIADPYRWLEDPDSAETKQFVAEQAALTEAYLSEIPVRAHLRGQMQTLLSGSRFYGLRHGPNGSQLVWESDGGRNQPLLYRVDSADGARTLVLDANTLSKDGTSAVMTNSASPNGRYLAFAVTEGGSDWQHVRVLDVASGDLLADRLDFVRFPSLTWKPDSSGFFYNGHTDPAGRSSANKNSQNKLFWHTLGTEQSADPTIYERPDEPDWNFPPFASDDKRWLYSTVWYGAINRNRVYIRPMDEDGPLRPLIDVADADYRVAGVIDDIFYIQTDLDAPRKRIVAIDPAQPEREHWREIVATADDAIQMSTIANRQIVIVYLRDAANVIERFDLDGTYLGPIELPEPGTVLQLGSDNHGGDLYFDYYSLLRPMSSYVYSFADNALREYETPDMAFDTSQYESKLIFATSADGTQVPLFVTARKGIALDGSNPTILYGYGGFSVNMTPRFGFSRLLWLQLGGVFVQAALRGGSEYGEAWHHAGMLENKQNVFDDFIASAEHLIAAGYTRSDKLAIQGGSNGGLLVAACMIQRPELFGAVLCHVPVIDMLRYQRFTAGRYWIPEYGDADNPEQFEFMLKYSPLHNVEPDTMYPPILILTADRDDRVVPMHAHKFAATLQSADAAHDKGGQNPLMLRFEFSAGHGFGKSTAKQINETADIHAFLYQSLGMMPI